MPKIFLVAKTMRLVVDDDDGEWIFMVMVTTKIMTLIANMFTAIIRVMKVNLNKLANLLVTVV